MIAHETTGPAFIHEGTHPYTRQEANEQGSGNCSYALENGFMILVTARTGARVLRNNAELTNPLEQYPFLTFVHTPMQFGVLTGTFEEIEGVSRVAFLRVVKQILRGR